MEIRSGPESRFHEHHKKTARFAPGREKGLILECLEDGQRPNTKPTMNWSNPNCCHCEAAGRGSLVVNTWIVASPSGLLAMTSSGYRIGLPFNVKMA